STHEPAEGPNADTVTAECFIMSELALALHGSFSLRAVPKPHRGPEADFQPFPLVSPRSARLLNFDYGVQLARERSCERAAPKE
ncbi:uncharacterized, partial [Tachysurus ichikawai]